MTKKDKDNKKYSPDNFEQQETDQTAEEFIDDKADWSEDISEYEKKDSYS